MFVSQVPSQFYHGHKEEASPTRFLHATESIDPTAVYDYVDTAENGANRRNNVMLLRDFNPTPDSFDTFRTYLLFTCALPQYARENIRDGHPSVRGYPGPAWATFFPFDFDDKDNPRRAMAEAVRFLDRLVAMGVPSDAVRIYFSGCKGIHLEVPSSLFGGFKPSTDIAVRMKGVARELTDGIRADYQIYDKVHLWRFVNTKHSRTGLYKIPLSPDELRAGDLDAIRELAKTPRFLDQAEDDGWSTVPALAEAWRVKPPVTLPQGENSRRPRAERLPDRIPEGERNSRLMSIAGTMQHRGMSPETIELALLAENALRCDPPLGDDEVRRIADSVSRYERSEPFISNVAKADKGAHHESLAIYGERGHLSSDIGIIRLSDVQPERVTWLWCGYLPLGKLTLLDGDPDLGKSLVTLDLAARVSRGDRMPDGTISDQDGPAGVVLLSLEDGLADTIRPRLDAAGADPQRIAALTAKSDGSMPTLDNIERLRAAILAVDAKLVIIDPVMAHLPGHVDVKNDQDIRRLLAPVALLADEMDVAILGIRHFTKGSNGTNNALYRGGGTIGLIGAARSGLMVAPDPDSPADRRILARTKGNLSAPVPSLAYRLVATPNEVARVVWEGQSSLNAHDLLANSNMGTEERSAQSEAEDFLREILANGPLQGNQVKHQAEQAGISDRTLRRARERLGVKPKKQGYAGEGSWMWSLPDSKMAITAKDGQLNQEATFVSDDGQDSEHSPSTGAEQSFRLTMTDGSLEPWETAICSGCGRYWPKGEAPSDESCPDCNVTLGYPF